MRRIKIGFFRALLCIIVLSVGLTAWAVSTGISFQATVRDTSNSLINASNVTVNAKILSVNGCILREEIFSSVNIVNGYISFIVTKGSAGGADVGLTTKQIFDNSKVRTGLTCINTNGSINGSVTSYTPTTGDARVLRVSFINGSDTVVADFNLRASAFAMSSETLNGKSDTDFAYLNPAVPTLNQTNIESVFNRFTKLDAILNSFNAGGTSYSGSVTGNVNGNATNVTGTVAIANGGTGQTSAAGALNALLPSQTGQANKVLQTNGSSVAWNSLDDSAVSFTSKTANTFFAAPNGASGAPVFRAIAAADLPSGTATQWTNNSSDIHFNTGSVGIGTSTPAAKLDVTGEVKIGNAATACSATNEGAQRYNSTSKVMEFCNGSSWTSFTAAVPVNPAGTVLVYAGASAPAGYLPCNGAAVSRTTYANLFAAIGTTYGAGDGSTTFNVPDLQGRIPMGSGSGVGLTTRTIGSVGGTEKVNGSAPTIANNISSLTANTEILVGTVANGVVGMASGYSLTSSPAGMASAAAVYVATPTSPVLLGGVTTSLGGGISSTASTNFTNGGDGTDANIQPYSVMNYVIKY